MKSHWLKTLATTSAVLALALSAEAAGKSLPPPTSRRVDFGRDIQPILEQSCVNCHGLGRSKGGFRLDNRETLLLGGDSGEVVKLGKSDQSRLVDLVAGVDADAIMPQKGKRLTGEQVGLLRAWIDQGMPWDPRVSLGRKAPLNLAIQAVELSVPAGTQPIDQILTTYFATNAAGAGRGISAEPPATWKIVSDRVFIRRAFLDVIGLLPSATEVRDFREDPRPDKRERLVEMLLDQQEAYAEHWLSFWNDLLRNDYQGTGYIDGGRKQITPWLYAALSTNMPYDHFVAALINPSAESAGFIKGIVWRGVVNASQTPEMQAAQNLSQVFMGVNLKCASCHDSFINTWRLSDAYGLASVFSEGPLEMYRCDKPTGEQVRAQFIYPELGEIDPDAPREKRLSRLAEIVTGRENGRLSRTIVNRLWARFFGYGLVEPVDDMEQPAWNQDLLDWLAADLVTNHYDLKKTISRVLSSRAYQLPSVDRWEGGRKDYVFRGPAIRRLSAEQFRDAIGQLAGVWYDKSAFSGTTNHVRASLVAADALATALGRPNREQVVTVRQEAATTLQALELTNGQTLAKALERGAQRLIEEESQPDSLISRLFTDALGRSPTAEERELGLEMLGNPVAAEGLEDLLWAMAMLPEFQLIY